MPEHGWLWQDARAFVASVGLQMSQEQVKQAVAALLDALELPDRADPELRQTPERVAELLCEDLLRGYNVDPKTILDEGTIAGTSGLVVVRHIDTVGMCPHHLLPALGHATVAFLPRTRIVGFGSLAELVGCFSRRLCLQEKVAANVADALVEHLDAHAAACILSLQPSCMTARHPRHPSLSATTSAYAGAWKHDREARLELMQALAHRSTTRRYNERGELSL